MNECIQKQVEVVHNITRATDNIQQHFNRVVSCMHANMWLQRHRGWLKLLQPLPDHVGSDRRRQRGEVPGRLCDNQATIPTYEHDDKLCTSTSN